MFFLGALSFVLPILALSQEVIESSGDISTLAAVDITAEPPSSGDLPTELSQDAARLNGSSDDLTGVEFINGFDSSLDNSTTMESNSTDTDLLFNANGTTSTQQSTVLSSTTTETPTTTTTAPTETPETTAASTSTTTMSTSSTTASTTTTPTTTTMSTTTTTTRRSTTTRRPRTTSTTRKPSTTSTRSSMRPAVSSAAPRLEAPCEILEDDFVCDVEISCFGEGTINCDEYEEDEMDDNEGMQAESPNSEEAEMIEEYPEEEEEEEQIEFFPPELVGKAPPKFPIVWKMKSAVDSNDTSSEAPTTVIVGTSTDAEAVVTTTGEAMGAATSERLTPMPAVVITVSASASSAATEMDSQMTAVPSGSVSSDQEVSLTTSAHDGNDTETTTQAEIPTTTMVDLANASDTNASVDASSPSSNDSTDSVPSTESPVPPQTTLQTEAPAVTTEAARITSEAPRMATTKRRRRKRESSNYHAEPSASESLQLSSQKSRSKARSCKISGNLQCTPMPSTVFCRGKATCRMISIEKSEKSATAKGVENWAIAVIVICATAALLTVGLLVYLVVTSWKKLKVQPQNGVTTLTYVNSTPP